MIKLSPIQVYKYCSRCGSKKFKLKGKSLRICQDCGLRYYFHALPATAVVLSNEQGEILLTKRATEPAKGTWDLPGGFTDWGETAEQAIKREILEELGIKSPKLNFTGTFLDKYLYNGIEYQVLVTAFCGRLNRSAKIKLSSENSVFKFVVPSKIKLNELGLPGIREIVERVISN